MQRRENEKELVNSFQNSLVFFQELLKSIVNTIFLNFTINRVSRVSNRINRMIISHWSLFDEQYVGLNRGSCSSPIRLSLIIDESPRECIADSSLNFRQLVNIHRMDWRKSTQLSSIICRESGVWGVSFEFRSQRLETWAGSLFLRTREPEIYCGFRVPFFRNPEPGWVPRSQERGNPQ